MKLWIALGLVVALAGPLALGCRAGDSHGREVAAAAADREVPAAWIGAWNSHDPDKVVAVFTDDVLYDDVPNGAVSHGRAELRAFAASFLEAVPDLRLELAHADVGGGHGTIEWTLDGTDRGIYKTGKRFSVRGVTVFDLRGGLIARDLDFYDLAGIMRQVGVLP